MEWTYKDRSRKAPAQENTYDCGVFTIMSIYLLLRGLELASTTYNQRAIYSMKVQRELHTSSYRGTSGSQERNPAPQPSWAQHADGRKQRETARNGGAEVTRGWYPLDHDSWQHP